MKKIWITGGNGFFASRFRKAYEHSYQIIATGKEVDIFSEEAVMAAAKEICPQYIIHTAALTATDFCNRNPDISRAVNVQGAVHVAQAAERLGAKMVFLSTEQVFNGNPEAGPYNEDVTPVPDTVYGQNKVEAESILRGILEGLWILRFTWLYGLPERGCSLNPNILWNTVQAALNGIPTEVSDNEFRGYTYVYDIIDQFETLFEIPFGLYHTGSKNDISRYDTACFILDELGLGHRSGELVIRKHGPLRDDRLDTGKIVSKGFRFEESTQALSRCIREFSCRAG